MFRNILFWLIAHFFVVTVSVAEAQQAEKVFRIGFLDSSTASGMAVLIDVFRQELSKLGWIEGKSYFFGEINNGRGLRSAKSGSSR